MKLFILLVAMLAFFGLNWARGGNESLISDSRVFRSERFSYRVDVPTSFVVDESIPELVLVKNSSSRLRINSGCLDFGVEGMTKTVEVASLGGIPAMKESYYLDSKLNLIVYGMTVRGACYQLELSANSRDGWKDVEGLARSFRVE